MFSKIDGYKSYFFSALIFLISLGYAFNLIDAEAFLKIVGILGGLLGVSLRHAIKKIE